mmetsp:Transcript_30864/g.75266  ORF Transcript_30864/g.75266 Transcript_30864/m.75266 type:complete len:313 (+) Transcript_30864:199-1137(+)
MVAHVLRNLDELIYNLAFGLLCVGFTISLFKSIADTETHPYESSFSLSTCLQSPNPKLFSKRTNPVAKWSTRVNKWKLYSSIPEIKATPHLGFDSRKKDYGKDRVNPTRKFFEVCRSFCSKQRSLSSKQLQFWRKLPLDSKIVREMFDNPSPAVFNNPSSVEASELYFYLLGLQPLNTSGEASQRFRYNQTGDRVFIVQLLGKSKAHMQGPCKEVLGKPSRCTDFQQFPLTAGDLLFIPETWKYKITPVQSNHCSLLVVVKLSSAPSTGKGSGVIGALETKPEFKQLCTSGESHCSDTRTSIRKAVKDKHEL